VRKDIQYKSNDGLFKFFRKQILVLPESKILELANRYEGEAKQIKNDMYRIAWYMRGSLTYDDIFYKISAEDKEILNGIIKENIDLTTKTKMPLI